MQVLFDHGTPRGLKHILSAHTVKTAREMGWERLNNGDLLKAAEQAGFDLLLTTDQRIQYQQNLRARRIAIVVLTGTTKWSQVKLQGDRIASSVSKLIPSGYAEVFIPFKTTR